ncbi:glutathione-specific gamma-glutamylcyclotransferase 1-like [Oppia nitens]|uniref:glutathione-specific gamma-glutamylcyclotransferase 1-like n=1 Tax=Oppia nitens TaxID=1686743 RepID=UPI0023DA5E00|nr:glutathione-specific gamma-glutamylcyclotransferase 1-like [Oppia nitens]
MSGSALWVFGYGSLIWNPGFEYSNSQIGRIHGYCRRFYQGSDTHRGNKQRIGRVVTLIEEEGVSTWGRAFQLTDESSTLAYLTNRESSLGGYTTVIAQFHPLDPREESFPVLVYIALPCNSLFLGSAPLEQIAKDIAYSSGICGPNVEYLAKLAAFMRIHLPHESDDHLFCLEDSVQEILTKDMNYKLLKLFDEALENEINDLIELKSVINRMDSALDLSSTPTTPTSSSSFSDSDVNHRMESSSKHTDRVTVRKLRCINK